MQPDLTDTIRREQEIEQARRFWLVMSCGLVLLSLACALVLAAADELHVWSAALIVAVTIAGLFGVAAEK